MNAASKLLAALQWTKQAAVVILFLMTSRPNSVVLFKQGELQRRLTLDYMSRFTAKQYDIDTMCLSAWAKRDFSLNPVSLTVTIE